MATPGGTVHIPVAVLPHDEATVKAFMLERQNELSMLANGRLIIGQNVVGTLAEVMKRFIGVEEVGIGCVPVLDTDGGPQIIVPKSGIIV